MNKNLLFAPLYSEEFFVKGKEHLQNQKPFLITGVGDSVRNHLAAAFAASLGRMLLVVCPNELSGREAAEELRFYFPEGTYFMPAKDPVYYAVEVKSNAIENERASVIGALRAGQVKALVVSAEALLDQMLPLSDWEGLIIKKRIGDELEPDTFLKDLYAMGYERVSQIEAQGQFSVRGGIIDIYPVSFGEERSALRIELWGDEIDSIRTLDVESQRSLERLEWMEILPASETAFTAEELSNGVVKLKEQADSEVKRLKESGETEAAERMRDSVDYFLTRLSDGNPRGIERYLPLFKEQTAGLTDYLPKDSVLCFYEPGRIKEKLEAMDKEWELTLESRLKNGQVLPFEKERTQSVEAVKSVIAPLSRFFVCAIVGTSDQAFGIEDVLKIESRSINILSADTGVLMDSFRQDNKLGYRTALLSRSELRIPEMLRQLEEEGIRAYPIGENDTTLREGAIGIMKGALGKGFSYPTLKFQVVSMEELAVKTKKKTRRRKKFEGGERIGSFSDLKPGDYVVHENHGIGLYQGVVQLDDAGTRKDYFKIVYKDGGVLYVPTTSLDLLQKFVAGEGVTPKMNRLAGNEWQRTKQKVTEGVQELAKELGALYYERQQQKGFAFSPDTVWQREFEDDFPFEETDDQLSAIEDTKRDMESTRIMDRLICGDVGYGKTEIAVRAAFKAVQDSKQVALLAPTTILAQQHYNTFVSRMKDYPVKIALLSRFSTVSEARKIKEDARKGLVDIIIGTHKILSSDLIFKDLGLLIVDEEQRFGVSHKEKIKAMKKNVDVLTLSATPIPRTLHMGLNGIRDMSLLRDAPMNRRPVQTYTMEADNAVISEAIYRELGRQGQVFYLYNHVNMIEHKAAEIQKLVPEARVEIAHGQMDERQLEKVMLRFVQGEIDVLVCTTIIETGLDIANANTLIVEDADKMGLSQLYQLRGRVGRSTRLAYAYFLIRSGKVLTEPARERLQAISEFTDFGSGFKIAMRDLEIRGAGNILGREQHGHMGQVGYDLYCKLLSVAMRQVKSELGESTNGLELNADGGDEAEGKPVSRILEDFETVVDIKVDAYLPSGYIANEETKLETYKKIAVIDSKADYEEMVDELLDRFGDMPTPVSNLVAIAYVKALAQHVGADLVSYRKGFLTLKLRSDSPLDITKLTAYLKEHKDEARLVTENNRATLVMRVEHAPKDTVMLRLVTAKLEEVEALR